MDIKERIDGLTEVQAKAALEWYTKQLPCYLACNNCLAESRCRVAWKNGGYEKCMENLLKLALKEARI